MHPQNLLDLLVSSTPLTCRCTSTTTRSRPRRRDDIASRPRRKSTDLLTKKSFFAGLVLLLTVVDRIGAQAPNSLQAFEDFDNLSTSAATPTAASMCGSCGMREDIRMRSLELIKGDVLKKMGLKSAVNVTAKVLPDVPLHVLEMLDRGGPAGMLGDEPVAYKTGPTITEEVDDFHVRTQKYFSFAQQYPRMRHSWRGHDILYFSLTDSVTKYQVGNASLFVYVDGIEKRPQPTVNIDIFKVFKNPNHPETPGKVKIASKRILQPLGRGDWVKIDITVMASEWFKSVRDNYGFIINGTINGRKVVVTEPTGVSGSKAPYMEVEPADVKRRTRRNLGLNCDDKMNERLCCRYPLTVDFEEFGWDFIIAPKRYEAHYCAGDCPILTMQKYPHTHLMEMASSNSAGPCCAPRKMSSISMLYFDSHFNIVFGNLPGMVVDRCGCS